MADERELIAGVIQLGNLLMRNLAPLFEKANITPQQWAVLAPIGDKGRELTQKVEDALEKREADELAGAATLFDAAMAFPGQSFEGDARSVRLMRAEVALDLGKVDRATAEARVVADEAAAAGRASDEARRLTERRWGILFQQGALFSSLTVRQNVQFPMREYLGISARLREEIAVAKLEMVGLKADVVDKFPSELSGGTIKRVARARALDLDGEAARVADDPLEGVGDGLAVLRGEVGWDLVLVQDLDRP